KQAADKSPKTATYWRNLGLAYRKQREHEKAIVALRQATMLDAKDYACRLALAESLVAANQIAEAITEFKAASGLRPTEFGPHYNLGLLYGRQNNTTLALQELQKADALRGSDAQVISSIGWVQFRAGRLPEAAATYERALKVDPKLQAAQVNLGAIRARQGQREQAIAHWREALVLNAGDAATRLLLAGAYLDAG